MAHRIRHLILALTLVCSGLAARAQSETAAAPVRQVTLQFNPSARKAIEGLSFRPAKGKSLQPVVFYSGYRMSPLEYKGPEKMEFFENSSTATEVAKPVAVCQIPEGIAKALLLFIPKAAPTLDGIKFDVVAIDDSMDKIAPGSFAVINISNHDYAAQYDGADPVILTRGISKCFRGTGRVMLQLAVQDGDRWDVAGNRDINLAKRNRVWVILYPPAKPNDVGPVIHTLTEELPSAPTGSGTNLARFP